MRSTATLARNARDMRSIVRRLTNARAAASRAAAAVPTQHAPGCTAADDQPEHPANFTLQLHQALHEGQAIVPLAGGQALLNSISSMRAQQFGAGRLGHPAQPSLLTYLYSPTREHAGIVRCPDCVLDMLAFH